MQQQVVLYLAETAVFELGDAAARTPRGETIAAENRKHGFQKQTLGKKQQPEPVWDVWRAPES